MTADFPEKTGKRSHFDFAAARNVDDARAHGVFVHPHHAGDRLFIQRNLDGVLCSERVVAQRGIFVVDDEIPRLVLAQKVDRALKDDLVRRGDGKQFVRPQIDEEGLFPPDPPPRERGKAGKRQNFIQLRNV